MISVAKDVALVGNSISCPDDDGGQRREAGDALLPGGAEVAYARALMKLNQQGQAIDLETHS